MSAVRSRPGPTGAARPGTLAQLIEEMMSHIHRRSADDTLAHSFRPALLGKAAILVDAKTGRVLWQLHGHERRQIASTTKIMTALLALRKLGPHDIVTIDKRVPRVPLVREGLRAG